MEPGAPKHINVSAKKVVHAGLVSRPGVGSRPTLPLNAAFRRKPGKSHHGTLDV